MYNKCFEYLLNNDPKKVISKNGIKIRKVINPVFLKIVPLTTKSKLTIEKREDIVNDRPIIYAATHGFRDDIAFTLMTIDKPVYLLYGSIPDFYKSVDGFALWLNGTIIVDRKDKESRKAAIEKIKYAIDLSSDILMYPEGVWNKNPALIVQKLYTGIYKVAKEKNALVVPIATMLEDNKGYSIEGEAYDITKLDHDKCYLIINKMKKNFQKIIDLIIYEDWLTEEIKSKVQVLMEYISNFNIDDCSIEFLEKRIDHTSMIVKEILNLISTINTDDYWMDKYSNNIGMEKSIIDRITIILKDTVIAKERICTDDLRDKMASLKWQLMTKYANYSRDDFKKFNPVSKYWDKYLEELIKTANGLYDHEIEDVAHYVDKTETTSTEIFDFLNNIELNNQNALVLTKVRKNG